MMTRLESYVVAYYQSSREAEGVGELKVGALARIVNALLRIEFVGFVNSETP